jgi:asparagine synthase (glutamine-hydrolysing)
MSVQFGRWSFEGEPFGQGDLHKAASILARFGPHGTTFHSSKTVNICCAAFHTTRESRGETQPHISSSGAVIAWDGRLDNREDLVHELRSSCTVNSADVEIVAAAYERWGPASLPKLLGDWALSVWEPNNASLLLAKDFLGARHLYYSREKRAITWSSLLDPLVFFAEKSLNLDEEYIAGWLSLFPAAQLTPYVGIHAVPPASYVLLRPDRTATVKYWDFDPSKKVRHASDPEYEAHFRTVFAESVRRRLRSNFPVLAELSGGMDSSSIVCIADTVLTEGHGETPRLDTVSYHDDSESTWNELPCVAKVEEKRGRIGRHIDVAPGNQLLLPRPDRKFTATPAMNRRLTEAARHFEDHLSNGGYRVLLSGIGGDEVLGGVPTPVPELCDLLARAHFSTLGRSMTAWALSKREPLLHLAAQTLGPFLPPGAQNQRRPLPWLEPAFVKRHRWALEGYPKRFAIIGPLPSFQNGLSTLDALRRQLVCVPAWPEPLRENRYPYLDRELLEFLFAIPRQQLVRPHQRRSLMRRSLLGIVPEEILNRKRKAFAVRGPLARMSSDWSYIKSNPQMISESLGIINQKAFAEAAEKARQGYETDAVGMVRTLALEFWLRSLELGHSLVRPGFASRASEFTYDTIRKPIVEGKAKVPLIMLLFAASFLLVAGRGMLIAKQTVQADRAHAYHDYAPDRGLPETLDPTEFNANHAAFVAYTLAARIPKILYQVPCYCGCDRHQGHQSLLDCFVGRHGVFCRLCQQEAIFTFEQNRRGRTAPHIRDAIASGKVSQLNLEKHVECFYRQAKRAPDFGSSTAPRRTDLD